MAHETITDRCYQEVEAVHRGAFSSIEASWQNVFELGSYAITIIFHRPEQFRWPILLSCCAIFISATLYSAFVRQRRGHLLHLSKCVKHPTASRIVHRGEYHNLPE